MIGDGRSYSDQEPLFSEGQGSADVFENSLGRGSIQNDVQKVGDALLSSCRSQNEFVVYRERWYILTLFSLLALVQSIGWNTWGPIEDTAMAVFGWNPSDVAILAMWGAATYLLSAFMFSWLLHNRGLRVSVVLSAALLVLGMGIRCLPVPLHAMKWTANMGQIFIGFSAPVFLAATTTISAVWFPSNERMTATSIGTTMVYLGIAASFVMGPHIVTNITPGQMNASTLPPEILGSEDEYELYESDELTPKQLLKHLEEIKLLLFIQFILALVLFVAALIYFPAKPKSPPAASAVVERFKMKEGMIAIVKKKQFWIPALAFSISTGTFSSWNTQLVSIFNNNVNQTTSGWIGFYANLAGVCGGIMCGRVVDYLGGRMKVILLMLMCGACAACIWTLLLSNEYIPFNTASLYCSVILFGFFVNTTVPLFLEITVESGFPVSEETITIMMMWLTNVPAFLFLIVTIIPSISTDFGWLNWMMLGSEVISIPLVVLYKEQFNRRTLDTAPDDNSCEGGVQDYPPNVV